MSRCFPFPPPGYEKKTRPDEEVKLFIKENPKEKKQKKDKKDKEKKERREKDKEKSSEKHREKKEKKHKHKDKKEKNRDKEEKKTSGEKKIVGLLDNQNSENFGLTGLHVDETHKSRLLLDLGKKVRNDNGAKEMQIVERIAAPDIKSSGKVLEHKAGILDDGNQKFKDKREENRIPNGQTVKFNAIGLANGFVRNFPPKDQKNIEGSFYQADKVMEKKKERKDTNKHKDTDGRGDKHKGGDGEKKSKSKDKKREKEKEKEKAKELSSPMSSKLKESGSNTIDLKNDKGSYLFKESNVQNINKRKEPEMDGFLDGLGTQNNKLPRLLSSSHQLVQTGNRIESSTGNQFALEKEATLQKHKSDASSLSSSSISLVENGRKLAMAHIAINIAPERQETVGKNGKANDSLSSLKPTLGTGRNLVSCQAVRSFTELEHGLITNNTKDKKVLSTQPVAENGSKLGSNQFNNLNGRNLESCQVVRSFIDLEEGMPTNNTRDKKVLSSQTDAENGRKLGSSQFNNLNAAERQGAACNPKLSGKESGSNGFVVPKLDERSSRINGLVELKKPSACSMGLPSASLPQKENVETRMKPPHPDAKYLNEILSVPKVEWSDVDEQKWLFSSEDHHTKKPKYVSPMMEESNQVWAEALQIESADITALPYVLPY